ncbi:MAG: transglycosylase domain-containing protein, partial [Deltaproteobacteria bacterium]|nr:transglycosylase domain-containing protein [Deltaproteobacteria bacterium]
MNPSVKRRPHARNPFKDFKRQVQTEKRGWSFFGGIARFAILFGIGCISGAAGIAAQGYFYFTYNLPSIEKLRNYEPPGVTTFYADNGEVIGEFAHQKRYIVPIERIPEALQNAFVAAEDKNFWGHGGVDKEAIVRAVKQNVTSGDPTKVGASTITQQVAKIFLLTPERKFTRKIKEAILSTRIEKALSKKQILYLYLNQIYLGSAAWGVESAARIYFNKHVEDLSLAECAMLAGLANAPSKNSPKKNRPGALRRRAYVLDRMLKDGYITQEEHDLATKEEANIVTASSDNMKTASDFVEHVRRYIEKKYGADALYSQGLQVYTTVDLEQTKLARVAIDAGLRELD